MERSTVKTTTLEIEIGKGKKGYVIDREDIDCLSNRLILDITENPGYNKVVLDLGMIEKVHGRVKYLIEDLGEFAKEKGMKLEIRNAYHKDTATAFDALGIEYKNYI